MANGRECSRKAKILVVLREIYGNLDQAAKHLMICSGDVVYTLVWRYRDISQNEMW